MLAANDANQIEFLYTRLAVLDSLETVVNAVGPEAYVMLKYNHSHIKSTSV